MVTNQLILTGQENPCIMMSVQCTVFQQDYY